MDVVAVDPRPIVGGRVIVQVKKYTAPVGVPAVRDLYGTMTAQQVGKAVLVSASGFTREAREFAEGTPIELVDRDQLIRLMSPSDSQEVTSP